MEWIALGVLALLLSGGAQPGPQDFGLPVTVQVELVSLRLQPQPTYQGREAFGYLALRPIVADSPERPAEEFEGFGSYAWLPAAGLTPLLWRLPADGRWHRPVLRERWRTMTSREPEEAFRSWLKLYPLIRSVGSAQAGKAGVAIRAHLEGVGWVAEPQAIWVRPSGDEAQVMWRSGLGVLEAFLRFRP